MNDFPHTIGGGDREGILVTQGSQWYTPHDLRRGRLVEWVCGMTAMRRPIPDSWWADHSGERDDDRVEHEECRPYLIAYLKVLAITGAKVRHAYPQVEVVHPTLRYQGHIDQVWDYKNQLWLVDLKNGEPQPWHALQLALYRDAYAYTYATEQNGYHLPLALNCYLPSGKLIERNNINDVMDARTLAKAHHIRKAQGLR